MYKVKVTNLPRWISEIHLKQFFNNCGKMVHATVALDKNTLRPLGHGYIEFVDEDAMNNALEKDNAMLDGAIIKVEVDTGLEHVVATDELIEPLEA